MRGAIGGLSNTAALTTRNETTRHGTRYAARTRKSTSTQPSTQRRRWAVTDREEVQRLLSATVVAGYETPDGDVRSEEHTSELQSLMRISYAVFCLKKKKNKK